MIVEFSVVDTKDLRFHAFEAVARVSGIFKFFCFLIDKTKEII